MVKQLDAVFEAGVLRPLEPLDLSERQRVRLTLDDNPAPHIVPEPQNFRREEMLWLANNSAPYAGQWVALEGPNLIAHGTDAATVHEASRTAGVEHPLLTHLPKEDELPFGGW